jgi:hypothetical protein
MAIGIRGALWNISWLVNFILKHNLHQIWNTFHRSIYFEYRVEFYFSNCSVMFVIFSIHQFILNVGQNFNHRLHHVQFVYNAK